MLPALRTLRRLEAGPAAPGACRLLSTGDRGSLDDGKPKTVLAVLYSAGELAQKQPRLLGCIEAGLGLRPWLESQHHRLICTSSKEGPDSELERHLPEADVLITTPFWPAYILADRIERARKLKLAVTAGVGSDHIDLLAAAAAGITVAEVTGCNVVSVAEHVVMQTLALVRNFMEGQRQVGAGEWDIARIAASAYDLEGKTLGTLGCGRIGQRVLQRFRGFDPAALLYHDYARLAPEREASLGAEFVESVGELAERCDVLTINCPLHEGTRGLVNAELIARMRPGSYIVNTARGAICDRAAIVDALESGHLAGYAGDVWDVQPAPADHPWRNMPRQAMTPHYSGTTLDAQARYAAGVRDILSRSFAGQALRPSDVIVSGGRLAPQYDRGVDASRRSLEFDPGWEAGAAAPGQ